MISYSELNRVSISPRSNSCVILSEAKTTEGSPHVLGLPSVVSLLSLALSTLVVRLHYGRERGGKYRETYLCDCPGEVCHRHRCGFTEVRPGGDARADSDIDLLVCSTAIH